MPGLKIRAEYEQLESTAQSFTGEAQNTSTLRKTVEGVVEQLRSEGWVGVGAEAFYAVMDNEILPAMNRLSDALQGACQAVDQVCQVFHGAEDEAAQVFESSPDSADGLGGSAAGGGIVNQLVGLFGNARPFVKADPIRFVTPPVGSLGDKLAPFGFKQDGATCASTTELILVRALGDPTADLGDLSRWEKFRAALDPGFVLEKFGHESESYSQPRWFGEQDPDAARTWLTDQLANNKGVVISVEADRYDPQHYSEDGKPNSWGIDGHALIVTGVVRDAAGNITHYQVIDPNFADQGAAGGHVIQVGAPQLENAWADRGFQAIATKDPIK